MTHNLNVSYSDYARATGMTEMNARYMLEALQTQLTNSGRLVGLQSRMSDSVARNSGSNFGFNSSVVNQYAQAAELERSRAEGERSRNATLEYINDINTDRIEILKSQITEYQLIQAARDKVNYLEVNALKAKQKRILAGREFERQQKSDLFAKYSYREKAKFYKSIKSRIEELTNVSMIAYNHLNVDNSAIKDVEDKMKNLDKFMTVEQVVETGWIWKTKQVVSSRVENPNYAAELAALRDKLTDLQKTNNVEEQKLLMLIDPVISLVFENPISFKICSMAERVGMSSIEAYGVVPTNDDYVSDVMVVDGFEREFNVDDFTQIKFTAIIAAKKKIAGQKVSGGVKMFELG